MAEIISGLFGVSPELLQQQRAQQDMIRAQQIAQTQRNPIGAAIGLQFGQSLGRGLLGGLGFQDPELQRATQLQNVLQETQAELGQEGLANPELLYTTLADKLNTAGFAKEAALTAIQGQSAIADYRKSLGEQGKLEAERQLSVAKTYKELQPELTEIEKLIRASSRAEGVAKDQIDAVIAEKTRGSLPSIEQQIVQLSNKKAAGTITKEEETQLDYLDNFKTKVAKASASTIEVATGKAESKFAEGVAKISSERQFATYDAAQKAPENLAKIDDTIRMIETSDARTGIFSETLKNVDRAVALLGGKEAAKRASDTEILNALLGSEVFPQIGALGIGARGLDTPAEREFLREVMAGTITMNKEALLRMAQIRRNVEERALNKYNTAVEKGELDDFFTYSKFPKQKISDPGVAIVSGKQVRKPVTFTADQWEQYKRDVGATQ